MRGALELSQHDEHVSLVGDWPDQVTFSTSLLELLLARPEYLWCDGDDVTLNLSNAQAHYRIVERHPEVVAVLVHGVRARRKVWRRVGDGYVRPTYWKDLV